MGDYIAEFVEVFTEDMRQIVVGERVFRYSDPLPSFHPDMPVGSVAHWDADRVIVRLTEISWQLATKVQV